MSYSVRFDDGSGDPRGLLPGHDARPDPPGQWADSLPAGRYGEVRQFLQEGQFAGTDRLSRELRAAVRDRRPGAPLRTRSRDCWRSWASEPRTRRPRSWTTTFRTTTRRGTMTPEPIAAATPGGRGRRGRPARPLSPPPLLPTLRSRGAAAQPLRPRGARPTPPPMSRLWGRRPARRGRPRHGAAEDSHGRQPRRTVARKAHDARPRAAGALRPRRDWPSRWGYAWSAAELEGVGPLRRSSRVATPRIGRPSTPEGLDSPRRRFTVNQCHSEHRSQ